MGEFNRAEIGWVNRLGLARLNLTKEIVKWTLREHGIVHIHQNRRQKCRNMPGGMILPRKQCRETHPDPGGLQNRRYCFVQRAGTHAAPYPCEYPGHANAPVRYNPNNRPHLCNCRPSHRWAESWCLQKVQSWSRSLSVCLILNSYHTVVYNI